MHRFETLRLRLQKSYKPYTDRGKMFSKQDNLKKAAQTAMSALQNYPATREQMKSIAKTLYELADCAMSKNLGSQTVLSGTVSKTIGKDSSNRTMQMIERPLMTVDELKSMPKGHFVIMKTGCHPMKTRLKLFFKWGVTFDGAYSVSEKSARKVQYADKGELERAILRKYPPKSQPISAMPIEMLDEDFAVEKQSRKKMPRTRKDKIDVE